VCPVNDLVFGPDPLTHTLAIGYSDGDILLFDIHSQHPKAIASNVGSQILAVSPDGRTLASGNSSSIQLFEFATLKRLYNIELSDYQVSGLCFTSTNNWFLAIQDDQCEIWAPLVLSLASEGVKSSPVLPPVKVVTAESSNAPDLRRLCCCPIVFGTGHCEYQTPIRSA
jgi:WD40 repeat protein